MRCQCAVCAFHNEDIGLFFISRFGPAQVGAADKGAEARVVGVGYQQVGGVGPGRFAGCFHGRRAWLGQRLHIVAFVFNDPADHAHDQGQVGAGQDRLPAVARTGGQAG